MGTVMRLAFWLRAGMLATAPVVALWVPAAQAQPPVSPAAPKQTTSQPLSQETPTPATAASQGAIAQARAQERAHLQQQRHAIDAAFQQAQAACYQRFAVEDCLKRERRRAREATAALAQRETALNEAERRERAALRLSDIAERKKTLPEPVAPFKANPSEISDDVLQQERDFEAHQRAERLQQKQQRHAAEVAGQIPQRAAAAEKARQRLEEKRQAAERRRARALQTQQERAAGGHKQPAALDSLP